jgi:hypothetical protein
MEELVRKHRPGHVATDVMSAVEFAVKEEMTRVTS